LRPKRIPPEQEFEIRRAGARKRARVLRKLPRGTSVESIIFSETRPAGARITFIDGGGIEKRFLTGVKGRPGAFAQHRSETFPDIETAYRKTGHEIESLSAELNRELEAQGRINRAHASAFENWAKASAGERAEIMNELLDIVDLLQPRHERSESLGLDEREEISRRRIERLEKKAAVERLEKAIDLLKKGNTGAAFARIAGASNSIIGQGNILRDQLAATKRDREILANEIKSREGLAKAHEKRILPKEKIPIIRQWSHKARLSFAAGQLGLFADKLEIWLPKARQDQRANMKGWLKEMRNALAGLAPAAIMEELTIGHDLLEANPGIAKHSLNRAAEALVRQAKA
jgi:hypothetical protein